MSSLKNRIWLFASLLITVILLVILYASGILRFGLSQQFTYILYAIAGLLAAVTCFGLLSSFGHITNQSNGTKIELGGAIVAFVVVAGGGAVYEKYFHTPEFTNMTIAFVNDDKQSVDLTGTATLFIGAEPKNATLKKQSNITFVGIPSSSFDQPINLELKADYSLDSNFKLGTITNNTVLIHVKHANPYEEPEKSELKIVFDKGSLVEFGPEPAKKNVVLYFTLYSQSPKLVPLSTKVNFSILSNSGVAIYSQSHNLDEAPIISPKNRSQIILDLLIPKTVVKMSMGKTAEVTFYYDPIIKDSHREYSQVFDFTESAFSDK
jgi:hypothetical protein